MVRGVVLSNVDHMPSPKVLIVVEAIVVLHLDVDERVMHVVAENGSEHRVRRKAPSGMPGY